MCIRDRRYTNEGCGSFVPQCVGNAVHTQAESYLVMSKDVIDEFVSRTGYEGLQADMDEAAAQCPGDNVYKACLLYTSRIAPAANRQPLPSHHLIFSRASPRPYRPPPHS